MMNRSKFGLALAAVLVVAAPFPARASDHLDTPTVTADPAADVADLYAWMAPQGGRVNLAMTVVGHRFSDKLFYVFEIGSGRRFGSTTASTTIQCRFDAANTAECWAGDADYARGNARMPEGLISQKRKFRVFAGLRDDPFFNNVKGTRAALSVVDLALKGGAVLDPAGCPPLDGDTVTNLTTEWHHTLGGPPKNLLAGWKVAALVISIDLDLLNTGGELLAVWSATYRSPSPRKLDSSGGFPPRPTVGAPLDRSGRPLTGNALLGPFASDEISDRRKEQYNRAPQSEWSQFQADLAATLAVYDGFDGTCGNQWLASRSPASAERYSVLAKLLTDDRLWIDSRSLQCTQYLAVERTAFTRPGAASDDCGGRTPVTNASNIFRSLLVKGLEQGVDDGLSRDEQNHSTRDFPFLAAP